MKVLLWGAGRYCSYVMECLKSNVEIIALIDSKEEYNKKIFNDTKITIYTPDTISLFNYNYIIITSKNYEEIKKECIKIGVPIEKIVVFWKEKEFPNIFKNRMDELLKQKKQTDIFRARLDSAPYEWGMKKIPKLESASDLLKKIIIEKSSLCRYGDGEFEIMFGRERAWFQKTDPNLAKRLREIIISKNEKINVAVAQNFENLDRYKDWAADDIRIYMEGNTRDEIISILDKNKTYYDAYVSRPYLIYKDSSNADEIFDLFKKIWSGRDICIIEGENGRFGLGNDLISRSNNVQRISCSSKNAWDRYEDILNFVYNRIDKNVLILISLGPTATVLAYDLAVKGYQALDIGQLDNEYDWYQRKVEKRIAVQGKHFAEIQNSFNDMQDIYSERYNKELISGNQLV